MCVSSDGVVYRQLISSSDHTSFLPAVLDVLPTEKKKLPSFSLSRHRNN